MLYKVVCKLYAAIWIWVCKHSCWLSRLLSFALRWLSQLCTFQVGTAIPPKRLMSHCMLPRSLLYPDMMGQKFGDNGVRICICSSYWDLMSPFWSKISPHFLGTVLTRSSWTSVLEFSHFQFKAGFSTALQMNSNQSVIHRKTNI